MKRSVLIRYLRSSGCVLRREGGKHSWWENPGQNKRTAVPRHSEVRDSLVDKICKDLGLPRMKRGLQ